jgi:hypothetical protein
MQGFDIYFVGEMLPDADPDAVKIGVAGLFKLAPDSAERLFSGKPVRVKQAVDPDTASRYRAAFREVGALVQIVPEGSPAPATRAAVPPAPKVSPAEPGLSAELPVVEESDDFDLAAPGATIDPKPSPPPAHIDTGHLEALPANTGSLEDCKVDKPSRPIPDISHIKLVDH